MFPFDAELDLETAFGQAWNSGGEAEDQSFTANPWDHSAQFLHTNAKRWKYWDALLTKAGIAHNSTP